MNTPNNRFRPTSSAGLAVGLVGATDTVGEVLLRLIEERGFPAREIRLFSHHSPNGSSRRVHGFDIPVRALAEQSFIGLDVVFLACPAEISRRWAPKAVEAGAMVIDLSAAFRLHPKVPLIVPEINGSQLDKLNAPTVIACPEASTVLLAMTIAPLVKHFGVSHVRIATYQSASLGGLAGIEELLMTTRQSLEGDELEPSAIFSAPIAFNCVPQIGSLDASGFCDEETKLMAETRKLLEMPDLAISAFTVCVPTLNSHAAAVWVTLARETASVDQIAAAFAGAPGLDFGGPAEGPEYPTPLTASGRDPVYVGRIRRDPQDLRTWLMWTVADNLRKGAALNSLQIAERIFGFN